MAEPAVATMVRTLRPEDLPRLRLDAAGGNGAVAEARRVLEAHPGRSVWAPDTLEYALVAPWRHRSDIAHLLELRAVRHAAALLRGVVARSRALGDALVLAIEMNETRRPAFYAEAGLDPLDTVITYDLDLDPRPGRTPAGVAWQTGTSGRAGMSGNKAKGIASTTSTTSTGRVAFRPALPSPGADLPALVRLDHAAFPWLWWNSPGEFAAYADVPGVGLYLGTVDGAPVCYVGVTVFAGWGHLDRVAVAPAWQGRGIGREALAFAVDLLTRHGANRVGLSTQRDNVRSQRLYERFGFKRSPGYDYRLFGAVVNPPLVGEGESLGDPMRPWAREANGGNGAGGADTTDERGRVPVRTREGF